MGPGCLAGQQAPLDPLEHPKLQSSSERSVPSVSLPWFSNGSWKNQDRDVFLGSYELMSPYLLMINFVHFQSS